MTDPAEEAERVRQMHGVEQQERKRPRQPGQPAPDPLHVVRIRLPEQPGTDLYVLCRWSTAARLVRDAAAAGDAGQVEDLGPDALKVARMIDPASLDDGRLMVHVGLARDGRWVTWELLPFPPEPVPGSRDWGAPRN